LNYAIAIRRRPESNRPEFLRKWSWLIADVAKQAVEAE